MAAVCALYFSDHSRGFSNISVLQPLLLWGPLSIHHNHPLLYPPHPHCPQLCNNLFRSPKLLIIQILTHLHSLPASQFPRPHYLLSLLLSPQSPQCDKPSKRSTWSSLGGPYPGDIPILTVFGYEWPHVPLFLWKGRFPESCRSASLQMQAD